MSHPFVLSFKENVSLIEQSSDRIIIKLHPVRGNIPSHFLTLQQISPGLLAAMRILVADGATEEHLSDLVLKTDDFEALAKFYYYLQKFINLGMLCHTVLCEGLPLATRIPISSYDKFLPRDISINRKLVLSRFAYCHKDKEHLVIESPLSHAKVILADWKGIAVISELANPQAPSEICTKIPGISEDAIHLFLNLLLSTEILWEVKGDGEIQEEKDDSLVQWEFHDLLFHSRTRIGRHSNPVGKTFRFLGKIEQLPVVKPRVSDEIIELYKPDIQRLQEMDRPLTLAIEQRDSIRSYQNQPIIDKQLGEFLYRSARVKAIFPKDYGECSIRPYPNSGGRYELELYITINICENIPSGLYHYSPKEHQLCRISEMNGQVEALLAEASSATGQSCIPQILITVTARFQRATWVYESIAYAGVLKNVGALQQTMYLVATAMNLAPCAVGSGNADLFAALVGADYYKESSVGEFILGSKPTQQTSPVYP